MPANRQVSPEHAMVFVRSIQERLSIVPLTGSEYCDALQASATRGIVGGPVYGALLAHCAIKAGEESIYTWNTRHHALCGGDVVRRLRTP
jgi:hypothetical protein